VLYWLLRGLGVLGEKHCLRHGWAGFEERDMVGWGFVVGQLGRGASGRAEVRARDRISVRPSLLFLSASSLGAGAVTVVQLKTPHLPRHA
jgi:hypothetical protein